AAAEDHPAGGVGHLHLVAQAPARLVAALPDRKAVDGMHVLPRPVGGQRVDGRGGRGGARGSGPPGRRGGRGGGGRDGRAGSEVACTAWRAGGAEASPVRSTWVWLTSRCCWAGAGSRAAAFAGASSSSGARAAPRSAAYISRPSRLSMLGLKDFSPAPWI